MSRYTKPSRGETCFPLSLARASRLRGGALRRRSAHPSGTRANRSHSYIRWSRFRTISSTLASRAVAGSASTRARASAADDRLDVLLGHLVHEAEPLHRQVQPTVRDEVQPGDRGQALPVLPRETMDVGGLLEGEVPGIEPPAGPPTGPPPPVIRHARWLSLPWREGEVPRGGGPSARA